MSRPAKDEQRNAEQKAEDQQPGIALRDGRQRHDVVENS